jgi:serine/threonine protein kinase
MTAPATTNEFLELVFRIGICSAEELDARLGRGTSLPGDPDRLAALLVRRGVLTTFQAKLLLAGRSNGLKLGPYVIHQHLGRGGMGIVYLAEHKTLQRKVALKVLVPPKDADGAKLAVERFRREARAAAALNHPNIVRLHDVGRQSTVNYLIMEYVEGATLEALVVRGGPITPSRAVGYIAQAAAGLQHAHEKGFIHRDIKPSNLMLSTDGTVKILDMGLARSGRTNDQLTERLDSGAVLGTADFIAPEQAMDTSEIDIRADIYSLGATFFALVTGKPPFGGTTPQKLMQHQMKSAPLLTDLDPTFPEGLAQVVAKMLAKKPGQRYQTPADVIDALAPWLPRDGETKVVTGAAETSVGTSRRLRKAPLGSPRSAGETPSGSAPVARRRRKAVLWGAGAGLFVLIALIGLIALRGSDGNPPTDNGERPARASNSGQQSPAPRASNSRQQSPAPNPQKVKHAPGQVVYRLEAAKVPNFRSTYEGVHPESGKPPPLPLGVRPECWKQGCRGEYGCGTHAGETALWVTNLTDVTASQYAVELETHCACPLEDGGEYAVRIEYRTQGKPDGHLYVQTSTYSYVAGLTLAPSEDKWKTEILKFRRPLDTPVRLTIGLKAGGEGTSLYFRSVEVVLSDAPRK